MILPLVTCYFMCKRGWVGLQHLHILSAKGIFQGKKVEAFNALVKDFLDQTLDSILQPKVLACFRQAQSRGEYTALLSNSPGFIVQQIAGRLGFDRFAGTEYLVRDGKFCAQILKSMEGPNKAAFVEAELQRLKLTKERAAAYSDSILDAAFLESAGSPVAVNPDKKLMVYAQARGWVVL